MCNGIEGSSFTGTMLKISFCLGALAASAEAFAAAGVRPSHRAAHTQLRQARIASAPQALMGAPETVTLMLADGGGGFDIVGTALNVVFTAVCLGLVAYIASFATQAAGEIGSQTAEVVKYRMDEAASKPKDGGRKGTVYDDTGDMSVSDEQVRAELKYREEKGKGSIQNSADGKKFAPWLDIDEDAVARTKAARAARLAGEEQEKKKNPFGF